MISIDQSDVKELNSKLEKLSKSLDDKTVKAIMRKNAKPFIKTARLKAPVARRVVKRYNTAKLSGKLKAPKGYGKVVASYAPGNLGRSIRSLPLRRLKKAVLVGPKKAKRNDTGLFKSNRVDGFYGHFVEFGTRHSKASPFVAPAWAQSKDQVLRGIESDLSKHILKAAS